MRALDLLERLASEGRSPSYALLEDLKRALRSHVKAELTKRPRRKAGGQ
jgi:hypothetical protein